MYNCINKVFTANCGIQHTKKVFTANCGIQHTNKVVTSNCGIQHANSLRTAIDRVLKQRADCHRFLENQEPVLH